MRPSVKIAIFALATLLGLGGWKGLNALLDREAPMRTAPLAGDQNMTTKVKRSEKEWKAALTPEQYEVMRKCGTERPFTGKYNEFWQTGVYVCAGCGTPLFLSSTKYDHGTGWPSFTSPAEETKLEYRGDYSLLAKRVFLGRRFGLYIKRSTTLRVMDKTYRVVGTAERQADYDEAWLLALAQHADHIFDIGCNIGRASLVMSYSDQVEQMLLADANPEALA